VDRSLQWNAYLLSPKTKVKINRHPMVPHLGRFPHSLRLFHERKDPRGPLKFSGHSYLYPSKNIVKFERPLDL